MAKGPENRSIYTNPGDEFIRFYNQHLPNSFFLSNFYPSPITLTEGRETLVFQCAEAVFQGLRSGRLSDYVDLTGHEAWILAQKQKKEGVFNKDRAVDLESMEKAVKLKFEQNAELGQLLLSTGRAYLVERAKNNKFWADSLDGTGENQLGRILMATRKILGGEGPVEPPQSYLDFVKTYPKHW